MLEQLKNLNRNKNTKFWDERTKEQAPHKPFLLLSILDGIDQGWITDNRIYPSDELAEYFFRYWDQIFGSDKPTKVSQPFYHLEGSFWKLKYREGAKKFSNTPSWGAVKERIEYAELDAALYNFMKTPKGRMQVRSLLQEEYFGDVTATQVNKIASQSKEIYYLYQEMKSMVAEPFEADHSGKVDVKYRESKRQQRDLAFSKNIRESYNYTCALCRDRVKTPSGKVLVQGAHILPWSESLNDDPRNGISMCPNHHWMFDSYMLTIRPDYSVKLSKWVEKPDNLVKDIQDLKDEKIKLPDDKGWYPAEPALADHNQRFEEFHKRWK